MSLGILSLPVLPVRSEPSERSELTTQLMFGEVFEILEVKDSWTMIRNQADGYQGWVTSKMLTVISDDMKDRLLQLPTKVLREPITIFKAFSSEIFLPAGSRFYVKNNHYFHPVGPDLMKFTPQRVGLETTFPQSLSESVLQTALQFMNAPYLWGGKTILGMDCSGLTQVSASINGFQLPRDASDQAQLGKEEFLSMSLPGDLAFFSNSEGRIVHVGLVCGQNKILHASSSVHIDDLDEQGIFSRELKKHTHQLHSIKRIFPS